MEIFLDTASLKDIEGVLPWGIISGITTNQKIFLAEKGVNFKERVQDILSLLDGPLSVELTNTNCAFDELIEEAKKYSSWNPKNVVIKVPMYSNGMGLWIVSKLREEKIKTNMTVLVNTNQIILAAKAGATYTSIFFNRARDAGIDPVNVIRESKKIIEESGLGTKIIVGSIRKPEDVTEAAAAGAHVITIPHKILVKMVQHQKTEETIAEFDRCWVEFKKAEKGSK